MRKVVNLLYLGEAPPWQVVTLLYLGEAPPGQVVTHQAEVNSGSLTPPVQRPDRCSKTSFDQDQEVEIFKA